MSAKLPEVDLLRIEGQGDNLTTSQIVYATGTLSDREILTAVASLPELRSRRLTQVEAVNALVAQQILDCGIRKGAPLLLPTAALIERNVRGECFDCIERDDGSLWRLRKDLAEGDDRFSRMATSINLGDRGTHYAARIGGGYLDRTMAPAEAFEYCRKMALAGYQAALDIATMMHTTVSRVIEATIPIMLERFEDVVKILRELLNKRLLEADSSDSGILQSSPSGLLN